MRIIISFTLSLLFYTTVFAQGDSLNTSKKKKVYLAIIKKMDGDKIKGWFYKMDDSTVYLLPAKKKHLAIYKADPSLNKNSYSVSISAINSISFQKKNAALHGALIGLGIGAVTGATAGLISGDDPVAGYTGDPFADIFIALGNSFAMTAGEKALAYGAGLAGVGALTGFIVGKIAKKKFIIGGNIQVYHDLQAEFSKRVIIE